MKNKLVIVTDLGCMKAYRVEYDEWNTGPRVELVETFNTNGRDRLSEQVTDEAGRFTGGSRDASLRTSGERHNVVLELERRLTRVLADSVNKVAKRDPDMPVFFAANKEIHYQILERLQPEVRARIEKSVPEDLTKINGTKLLHHFTTTH